MANAPGMALIESATVKNPDAGRSAGTAAAAKRAGRADRAKTGAPTDTFANALKRAREDGRTGDPARASLRKTAAKSLKPLTAESLSETVRGKPGSAGEAGKKATGDSARNDSSRLVSAEEGAAVRKRTARKSGDGASLVSGGAAPSESMNGEGTAEDTRLTGALAAEASAGRGRTRTEDKRTDAAREASAAKAVKTGDVADPRRLASKAPRVVVEDKRVAGETRQGRPGRTRAKGETSAVRTEPVTFRLEGAGSDGGENRFTVAETDIELSPGGAGRTSSRNAAAELSRKLDAQAGNEIVRQVKVVLNRANAGEVRINLRPENLGRVRVRIQMEDNRLTGRIFVESAAAREAFRNALDGLQAKLVESGFGAADLELAWDEGNADLPQFGNPSGRQSKNPGAASREFEGMSASAEQEDVRIGDGRVDMVV